MRNLYEDTIVGELTLEMLLDHEALAREKTILRKAFSAMLNRSATGNDPNYASMVLETSKIILNDMGLGSESVKCLILKNVADSGDLAPDLFDQEFGQGVRLLIEGIRKLERIDTKKYITNKENLIGLIVTLSDDIRVPLIRLGMRLYDMRHL